ncbi:hypothetical protein PHLGIDRAFT_122743 [Phlebiopsis gigantea 11061_1 CR5-6]|uniref:T6SS Phospholipase effector Tle1-like catalytic domain-containing protein n=1 Tax=Phlebiopsis gigantea (strain 11061_1 CR5-6) TaxID=745531 RepID=A0A0C3PB35_PHLG1|nr:hypothetical protein PHLGIDRAFT_122743 [Phlebiopsis gigantea 11061_1 CR5-6]
MESDSATSSSDHDSEASSETATATPSHAADLGRITLKEPSTPSAETATASESRVTRCKCPPPPPEKKGRNLVVCIDGTANQFSLNNTHVVELYSRLEKNDKQLTYYDSGIGTFVKPSNWIGWLIQLIIHIWDMMVAWGNNNQIGFAYELYLATMALLSLEESNDAGAGDDRAEKEVSSKDPSYPMELCNEFKRTLCHDGVRAHFVGVWDTVSSVGITRGPSLPETTTGMSHVCGVCHCIALDERRNKFQPEYVNGGKGPSKDAHNIKEVWFAGSHSDIGGGNTENLKSDGFGPPLRWILYEAMDFGLRVKPFKGAKWKPSEHHPSLVGVWKLLEYYPFRRLSYNTADEKDNEDCCRWPPNLGRGRHVQPGQKIHASVLQFMKDNPDYKPAAELNNGCTWDDVRTLDADPTDRSALLVSDLYSSASDIIAGLDKIVLESPNAQITRRHTDLLGQLTSSSGGGQSIIDVPDAANILLRSLEHLRVQNALAGDEKSSVFDTLVQALSTFPSLPEGCLPRANSQLRVWLDWAPTGLKNQIIRTFGNGPLYKPQTGHTTAVWCVAFSPDGTQVAYGCSDCTIRLCAAETWQPIGEPLYGHSNWIWAVAFSPDGTRIVSGSRDKTLRLWDAETHQAVGTPLTGHQSSVRSAAFSPDGKLFASGSDDKTIRIWDAKTRRLVGEPLCGHKGWVASVAFSPDGRLVASGSGDDTGHSNAVSSVVFSPDGRCVVSGSSDDTIRVWYAETGEVLLGPLRGHTNSVSAVAVSSDGRYIVSGSYDNTVRPWDARTGEAIGEPLRGHMDRVQSVAFSPDGHHMVSGSSDKSLMVWEVEL